MNLPKAQTHWPRLQLHLAATVRPVMVAELGPLSLRDLHFYFLCQTGAQLGACWGQVEGLSPGLKAKETSWFKA